jgi:hypothetical protein
MSTKYRTTLSQYTPKIRLCICVFCTNLNFSIICYFGKEKKYVFSDLRKFSSPQITKKSGSQIRYVPHFRKVRKSNKLFKFAKLRNLPADRPPLVVLAVIIVSCKLVILTFVTHQSQRSIHVFNRPMTEGYGDIACQTVLGKLVLACFLSVGLVSSFPPGKTGTKKLGFLATF